MSRLLGRPVAWRHLSQAGAILIALHVLTFGGGCGCRMMELAKRTGMVLGSVRMGICLNEMCNSLILFRTPSEKVRCRFCRKSWPTKELRNVKKPNSLDEAFQWVQNRASTLEKAKEMGLGRWRAASRMIDGIGSNQHAKLMQYWFERFGVTEDGRVQRLAKMGRSDPINVATLSDYAFGIREEHMDVFG